MTMNAKLAAQTLGPTTPTSKPLAERPPSNTSIEFGDLIDAVNALHHLPVISTLYEAATGETIGAAARLAGGFLFGGPLGLLGSTVQVAFEAVTGDSIAGHAKTLAQAFIDEQPDAIPVPAQPVLPWMKTPDATSSTAKLPEAASLREALNRIATVSAALTPNSEEALATPNKSSVELPPQLLAKFYQFEAIEKTRSSTIRL